MFLFPSGFTTSITLMELRLNSSLTNSPISLFRSTVWHKTRFLKHFRMVLCRSLFLPCLIKASNVFDTYKLKKGRDYMKIMPFSYLSPAAQQKAIIKMREDYAFHQHVIYLIRKDIVAELNKYSKSGIREIYVNLPCLGESVGNFSLSFILHYQPKTKGYFENLVNESLDSRFLYSFWPPDVRYEGFSYAMVQYSSDAESPEDSVVIDGDFGELCGDHGETDETVLESLHLFIKDMGDDLFYHLQEIYEKSFSEEYMRDYIELMGLGFSEDGFSNLRLTS